ncbi:50S ribosomal protein L3 [Candidatus Omnitrophota bacterium]
MIKQIFGRKLGMTQVFTEQGVVHSVTLIAVGPCKVLATKKYPKKEAVLIGYQEVTKEKKKTKPQIGFFAKLNQPYYKYTKEIERLSTESLEIGSDITVDIFEEKEKVAITATSIGRGFQGGMKRHNWAGQPGGHGHTTHRRVGSVGASAYPSKIVKGHPMPGHMGNVKVTVRNLQVIKVDKERGLLFIDGSCPGAKNSLVLVGKSKEKKK